MSLIVSGGSSQPIPTPAQILARLLAVDGEASGLDADMVRGQTPPYAEMAAPGLPSGIPLMPTSQPFRNNYPNSLFRN